MKQRLIKSLMLIAVLLTSNAIWAYSFEVDGIYYKRSGNDVSVTYLDTEYNSYSGDVVIPATVTYEETTYNVTSIGLSAFKNCIGLTSVTIPNSVISIDSSAFNGCSGLLSVTIPNSVTSIKSYAFSNCTGLTSITIPNSVTSIDKLTFKGSYNLTSIIVESNNAIYDSRDNCNAIIETETNTLIFGCKSTIFPNTVTSIGEYAFSGCKGLTSIEIPNTITSIGSYAFYGCSDLTSVTIPNSVTILNKYTFWSCSNLTSITIPNSIIEIGTEAFNGCKKLTSIHIPNSVTNIGNFCFTMCENLTSITIPSSCKEIGTSIFSDCNKLTEIIVDENNKVYDSRNNCNAIIETSSNTLIAACNNSTIPNGVKTIGQQAFSGCLNLTTINLPNSIISIGQHAFSGCENLEDISFPNSLTTIENFAFGCCMKLTSIYIPQSVTHIGTNPFFCCPDLETIIVDGENQIYDSRQNSNAIIETATNSLITGCKETVIPNTVTRIDKLAFRSCLNLTNIVIPNSVTSIGNSAFLWCSGLTNIKSLNPTPPTCGTSVFDSVDIKNLTLTVPAESVELYASADTWKGFGTINGVNEGTETPSEPTLEEEWVHNMSTVGAAVRNIACVSGNEIAATNMVFSGGADNVIFFNANGQTSKTHDVSKFLSDNNIGTTNDTGEFTPYSLGRGIDVDGAGNIVVNLDFPNPTSATNFVAIAPDGTMKHIECEVPSPGVAARSDFFGVTGNIFENAYIGLTPNTANYAVVYNIFDGGQDTDYSYLVNADEGTSFTNLTKVFWAKKTFSEEVETAPEFYVYNRSVDGVRYSDGTTETAMVNMGENFAQGNAISTGATAFEVNGVTYIVISTPDASGARASAFKVINVATGEIVAETQGDLTFGTDYAQDFSSYVNEDGTVSIAQLVQDKYLAMYRFYPNGRSSEPEPEPTVAVTSLTIDSEKTLNVGETATITATILPDNATNQKLVWTSSDENVATVDANGLVTAVAVGSATITATTTDGSDLSAVCEITVSEVYRFAAENATTFKGKSIMLPVNLVNSGNVSAFQFDIYLPEGITIPFDEEEEEYLMTLNQERATGTHSVLTNKQANGAIRYICNSSKSEAFAGESGTELFSIPLNISSEIEGEFNIEFKNIKLSSSDAKVHNCEDISVAITVKPYSLGDSNGDDNINIADIVNITNYVLGKSTKTFIEIASDVNKDGDINIGDVVGTVNLVLNTSTSTKSMISSKQVYQKAVAVEASNQESVFINDFTICANESKTIEVNMTNSNTYSGLEFNLHLPEGLTVDYDDEEEEYLFGTTSRLTKSHSINYNKVSDNVFRFVIYSSSSKNIKLNEGAIMTIPFTASADMLEGGYQIEIKNVIVSTSEADDYEFGNTVANITVCPDPMTGINDIVKDNTEVEYYNLQGVKVAKENLTQGVYIKKQGTKAVKVMLK